METIVLLWAGQAHLAKVIAEAKQCDDTNSKLRKYTGYQCFRLIIYILGTQQIKMFGCLP